MGNKLTGSIWPDPAKQQPYRYGKRECGRFAVVPYESVSQSQIDALAAEADAQGLNYEVSLTHGKARIEIEYNFNNVAGSYPGATTEVEERWELISGKTTKSLLDSRNPLAASASAGALAKIQTLVENNGLIDKDPATGLMTRQVWGDASSATVFTNGEMQLLAALLKGVDQVPTTAPVLSRTRVVTANYINRAAFTNVDKIFSGATLVSSESVPTAVLFDFPSDTDPSPEPIGGLGINLTYLYGWLKNGPDVRQVESKKWSISQTWEYGLWLINVFGGTRL